MDTVKLLKLSATLVCLLITSACCQEKRSPQPYWLRAMEGYWPAASKVKLEQDGSTRELEVKRWNGHTYVPELSTLRVKDDDKAGLEIWFRNESSDRILIDWANILYVDELGEPHETFSWRMGAAKKLEEQLRSTESPEVLNPADGIWRIVRPLDKTYRVYWGTFCENSSQYHESLLPWSYESKTESELREYVGRIHEEQIPVSWLVPVEVNGIRKLFTIEVTLKNTAEMRLEIDSEHLEDDEEEPSWIRKGHP